MWPFFRGKELEILLKREDALFELQTNSGMALVITLFAVFFTLLAAVLHGFDTIPPWIVGLESGAVTVMGYVYLRAFLYRRELFPDSETDGAIAPPSVTG